MDRQTASYLQIRSTCFTSEVFSDRDSKRRLAPMPVSEINSHLDVAGVFYVPTPLPSFQSRRVDAPQQVATNSVYFTDRLHSLCSCPWTLALGGMGGVRHWPQVGWVFISQTPVSYFVRCEFKDGRLTSKSRCVCVEKHSCHASICLVILQQKTALQPLIRCFESLFAQESFFWSIFLLHTGICIPTSYYNGGTFIMVSPLNVRSFKVFFLPPTQPEWVCQHLRFQRFVRQQGPRRYGQTCTRASNRGDEANKRNSTLTNRISHLFYSAKQRHTVIYHLLNQTCKRKTNKPNNNKQQTHKTTMCHQGEPFVSPPPFYQIRNSKQTNKLTMNKRAAVRQRRTLSYCTLSVGWTTW